MSHSDKNTTVLSTITRVIKRFVQKQKKSIIDFLTSNTLVLNLLGAGDQGVLGNISQNHLLILLVFKLLRGNYF